MFYSFSGWLRCVVLQSHNADRAVLSIVLKPIHRIIMCHWSTQSWAAVSPAAVGRFIQLLSVKCNGSRHDFVKCHTADDTTRDKN